MPETKKSKTLQPVILLTPEETGELLGIRPGTLSIWRCAKRYKLDYVKVGGKVRYRLADIERFVESRLRSGQAA
jgi:hypothetical protein